MLRCVRAPGEMDPWSIELHDAEGRVGFIPRADNTMLARLLDAGRELAVEVYEKQRYERRVVWCLRVSLVDHAEESARNDQKLVKATVSPDALAM